MIIETDRSMLERAHKRIANLIADNIELRQSRSLWRCFAILEGAALAGIMWALVRGWL